MMRPTERTGIHALNKMRLGALLFLAMVTATCTRTSQTTNFPQEGAGGPQEAEVSPTNAPIETQALSPTVSATAATALPTQGPTTAPTSTPVQLPGGRLLFSALAAEAVRNADPERPRSHEFFWLNLADLSVEPHALLTGLYPLRDQAVVLSPDLSFIVYEHDVYTPSDGNLYAGVSSSLSIAAPDGVERTQIGEAFNGDYFLDTSWSQDSLFFANWRTLDWTGFETSHTIYIYDLAAGSLRTLTIEAFEPDSAGLSADGTLFAYAVFGLTPGLFVLNTDGSGQHRLVEGEINGMAWHPDGRRVFYTQVRPEAGVFSVDVGSGEITRVAATSQDVFLPGISPDGRLLVYNDDGIVVVPTAGGEPQQLTQGWGMFSWAWSPDSQYLAYVAIGEAGGALYVMDAQGEGRVPVYRGELAPYLLIGWLP